MNSYLIDWRDETGSTNADLRQLLADESVVPTNLVVATSNQTRGRGRAGRVWQSGIGRNLCFSFFVDTEAPPTDVPSLGMAACLGIDDALRRLGIKSRPKWPNDVRVDNAKICGILCETCSGKYRRGAIVGVGLNVNMSQSEARQIDQPATSIRIETGTHNTPRGILESFLPQLDSRIQVWRVRGFNALRREFVDRCSDIGRAVSVVDHGNCLTGVMQDVGDSGECILKLDDGQQIAVWSGDLL